MNKDKFLVKDGNRAEWGVPEGYPWKEIGTILNGTFEFADNDGIYIHQIADKNFGLIMGKTYTVIWDGETYQCVATTIDNGPLVLGNLGILGAGYDTGEPFLFVDRGGKKLIGTNSTATTHTITVRGEIVYPMNNEYLQNSNIINDLADGSLKTRDAKEATGVDSFAEGYNTVASGDSSHAEGDSTTASGSAAHAEGRFTTASGNFAHAEGESTTASGSAAHAEGIFTTASGNFAHAEGKSTTASGSAAHAEGGSTNASGSAAHAEGSFTTASGYHSHAEGDSTTASGSAAHAEGDSTTASGNFAHAEGESTTASGSAAHAEGRFTTASGNFAHAEGDSTTASGNFAHAEGRFTTASGLHSHAEGIGYMQNITISGEAGATVYTVTSSIDLPIIEGSLIKYNNQIVRKILSYNSSEKKLTLDVTLNNNEALNSIQVIIVENGIAGGDYSHSEGRGSVAFSESQHVQGKYNIGDSSNKYAHIVGNGSSKTSRSNAHTLDWNGNAWFAGDVYVKGANQDDTAAIKLATINDLPQGVPAYSTANNGQFLRVIDGIPTWTTIANAEGGTY